MYESFIMGSLERLLEIRKELQTMGDFENCIDGVIGEMYVIERLNLKKSNSFTKGIDGFINGKSVQIKTKGGKKKYRDSGHYIQLKIEHEKDIDLLIMVLISESEITHRGPFEREKCNGRPQKNGIHKRYYLNDLMNTQVYQIEK